MLRLAFLLVPVAALSVAADATPTPAVPADHDEPMMACAKACDDCGRMCDACGAHCAKLVAGGKREHLKTLQTCQDCATVCQAASCVVARKGPFADLICTACADACKRCGEACEAFKDEPMMKRCAEECRKCETACREMLKHVGGK